MDVRLLQPVNIPMLNDVIPFDSVTFFSFEQFKNTFSPIDVTESGISNDVRLSQLLNASSSIFLMVPSKDIFIRLEQPVKHLSETDVMFFGRVMDSRLPQRENTSVLIVMIEEGRLISIRFTQSQNEPLPISSIPS